MIVKIDRSLKIRLLVALRDEYINTANFPEFYEDNPIEYEFSYLTEEEKELLLKIGEKALQEIGK